MMFPASSSNGASEPRPPVCAPTPAGDERRAMNEIRDGTVQEHAVPTERGGLSLPALDGSLSR